MKKVISIIILIILIPILIINVVILINSLINPNEVPSFFGWKPFIVLTDSMETEIYSGDIAVVKEVDAKKLKEGDIIAFNINGIVTTHRIKEVINEEGKTRYITKGDNNKIQDEEYVLAEQIEGLYQFKISKLGNVLMFMQTSSGMVISLAIPIILLILVQIYAISKDKKYYAQYDNKKIEKREKITKLKKEELKK